MPVVVTGAAGGVGRVLVPLLAERGQVRAVVRERSSAGRLASAGAKVAVCRLTDTATLGAVMAGAHTVVHLAGGLDVPDDESYESTNFGTVQDALEAAADSDVTRFVLLSYPGASPDSSNAYLKAKGRAEEAVRASGLEHVILRATHIYGPGQRWLIDMRESATRSVAATVVGSGAQQLAPVHVSDVASTLVAADDRAGAVQGTFALEGPDIVSADELVDLLAGRRRRKVHLPPAAARRAGRLLGRRLHPALLEVLASDSRADAPDAAAEFGIGRTPLREGLL